VGSIAEGYVDGDYMIRRNFPPLSYQPSRRKRHQMRLRRIL